MSSNRQPSKIYASGIGRAGSSRLPGHKFVKRVKEYLYLLSGIIKCGNCGSHYVAYCANGRSRKFYYYTCSRAKQSLGCNSIKLSATQLDSTVIDFFRRASQDQGIIVKAIGDAVLDYREKLSKVEKEIKQAEDKLKIAREKADKLLFLAMDETISKGPSYKAKMDTLDAEILMLQEKLSKLEAQRRVAQITGNSSEFLYSNIKFAMKHIDQAPPEAKKALLHALIKSITIFDDHVEMRMYVGQPFEEIACGIAKIAQNNHGGTPKNSSALQDDCRALTPAAGGLYDRPKWLPELDARRTSQLHIVHMVVKIYTRRSKKQLIRFGVPLPEKNIRAKRIIKNTIYEGLKIQAFINHGPGRITWAKASKELNISEAKLAHLLKIVNTLPQDFVENMRSCTDESMLKIFTGRRLLQISRLRTEKERRTEIERLLPKA